MDSAVKRDAGGQAQSVLTLSREQVRAVDRIAVEQFGMTGLVLMENAARGCADVLLQAGVGGPVLICAGAGNNGGDGLAMARHLANAGCTVQVLLWQDRGDLVPLLESATAEKETLICESLAPDAAANFAIALRMGIPITLCNWTSVAAADDSTLAQLLATVRGEAVDWVVDAWLGTGARLPLSAEMGRVLALVNQLDCRRMAVDLPTGLECDSARHDAHVFRADLTCTFVGLKPALSDAAADAICGRIQTVDIGVPRICIEQAIEQSAKRS